MRRRIYATGMEKVHIPYIRGEKGVYEGATIKLEGELTIGRDSRISQLIIERNDIGRKHVAIEYNYNIQKYIVTDYSDGGTKVFFRSENRCDIDDYLNDTIAMEEWKSFMGRDLEKYIPTKVDIGSYIGIGKYGSEEIFCLL